MCGRTACTLDPGNIRKACVYRNRYGNRVTPDWHDPPDDSRRYYPCYNLGPTKHSPVIVAKRHFITKCGDDDRIIMPMKWGFQSTFADSKLIINARCDTVLQKPTFRKPLNAGRRCVVLADGYFEWFRSAPKDEGKLPYFIHLPQQKNINICEPSWKELPKEEDDDEWIGPRLLPIAGMFEPTESPDITKDQTFVYSIITVVASKSTSHIHDRMPAILQTADEVANWLNFANVPAKEAVGMLKPSEDVEYYRVSNVVNNIRNNTEECIRPYVEKPKNAATKSFMQNWLQKGKRPSDTKDDKPPKKHET